MSNNFYSKLSDLSNLKGISSEDIKEMIKDSIIKIFQKNFDEDAEENLEFIFNEDNNEFRLINHAKLVIEDPLPKKQGEEDNYEASIEIPLSEAREINPDAEIDDIVSQEVDFERFSGKTYTQMRSLFLQNIREYEKRKVFSKYSEMLGAIVKAKLEVKTPRAYLFVLEDGAEAYMPKNAANLRNIPTGTILDVVISEVKEESKGAQVIVSSSEKILLEKALRDEIPELEQGLIEIVDIARQYGTRVKISVKTSDEYVDTIDPVGTMIGQDGLRIQKIEAKLKGEKIEVLAWNPDIKKYIMNALTPARVIDVIEKYTENENSKSFDVIVPDRQHTLAIGKKGINVVLAVELTNAKINVLSQTEAMEKGIELKWEGNITKEEIQKLDEGQKLRKSPKAKLPKKPSKKIEDINIDGILASEIAEFQSEMNNFDTEAFEKGFFEMSNEPLFSDEDFKKYVDEVENADDAKLAEVETQKDEDPYSRIKKEDYEKITQTKMKDFKADKDLVGDLDDIEWDDSDWE
ncbi:transcription termination factor NusA [[Mycoplasma] gypis]|uniref:Transcription termination/antitermination protein NusA n=1 Tax=[Mycoplasma] gypis TaxID=92404 RepID=A0ABZ2RQC2_9BACT